MSKDFDLDLQPLSDRVLLKRVEEESKTSGGILLPDTAKEKPQMATVVAVGPGLRSDDGNIVPMTVKVGDTVLLGKWGGTDLKVNGQEYTMIKESEILAVVHGCVSVNACGSCKGCC